MENCKSALKCEVSVLPGGKCQHVTLVFLNVLKNKAAHSAREVQPVHFDKFLKYQTAQLHII